MRRVILRFLFNVMLFAGFIAFGVAHDIKTGRIAVAPQWNPWLPLDMTLPNSAVQDWKIARARSNPAQCVAAMERVASVSALPDFKPSPTCISAAIPAARLPDHAAGAAMPAPRPSTLPDFT
jgi:hypothetical protein